MCVCVSVCMRVLNLEEKRVFFSCDFSRIVRLLLLPVVCVYIETIFLVENYIAHTGLSSLVIQVHSSNSKRLLLYSFKINDCRIFCVFLSLFISSVNVRVCLVAVFFYLFLSFFYLCYIFYFDVSCMYVWVLRVHSTTIIVLYTITHNNITQSKFLRSDKI